jgi:CheY-like chemotaxis protein
MADCLKTVLIAEDSSDEVFLMRRAFAKTLLPFQLRFVPNGREAIDYLERKPPYGDFDMYPPPSAVVLDLNMPAVGGFEVLAWMQAHPGLHTLPTFIHTSSELDSDRDRAMQLGARAYWVKSSVANELIRLFYAIAEAMPALSAGPREHPPSAVILQDLDTGLYFAGCEKWVDDPLKALDFETLERAARYRAERA